MTDTATIVTASTNLSSGKTTTTMTTLPPELMQLPKEERDLAASKAIVENDESLKDSEYEVCEKLGPVIDAEAPAYIKKDQSIITINNIINSPNTIVIVNPQDQSRYTVTITPENVFTELRKIVSAQISVAQEQAEILSRIQELEDSKGSSVFGVKYREFIEFVEKNQTLFNLILPFIPALAKFIVGA